MHKYPLLVLGLVAMISVLVSCGANADSGAAQLAFEAPMKVDSGQRFHVSLGVRNVGQESFRKYENFGGVMEIRNGAGMVVSRISVATLWELAPGNAGWPAAYTSSLPAGAYQLTWGTREYGSVTVDFTIVELDGSLFLGEESIQSTSGASPASERENGALLSLVDLARVNLAQRLDVAPEAVAVQGIEETEFPDASLGVPEPDKVYAQVITPGYAIKLAAEGQAYEYRASDERLAFVPQEGGAPQGSVTIEEVQVTASEQIVIRGRSTLPDGTCLGSELWADGKYQAWWPDEACVVVENGAWQMVVRLGNGEVPAELDSSAQYILRAFQQNGPDIVAVFPFDLAGPPAPEP